MAARRSCRKHRRRMCNLCGNAAFFFSGKNSVATSARNLKNEPNENKEELPIRKKRSLVYLMWCRYVPLVFAGT